MSSAPPPPANPKRGYGWIPAVVGPILLIAALWALQRVLAEHSVHDLLVEFHRLERDQLYFAGSLCILNYLILTGYDALGVRYVGASLSYGKTALTALISYPFSYNLGFALFTGGAVRYRLYTGWGLSAQQIAAIVGFNGFFFWLALCVLGGAALLIQPDIVHTVLDLPLGASYAIAFILELPLVCFAAAAIKGVKVLKWGTWHVPMPPLRMCISALMIASADWLVSAAILFTLIPHHPYLSFTQFLSVFLIAQLAVVISHVPGGLGVFETTMVLLLKEHLTAAQTLSSLIAFRIIFYLAPFIVALVLLAFYECMNNAARMRSAYLKR